MEKLKSLTIKNNEQYLRQISLSETFKNIKELKENIIVLENFCEENEVMAMAAIQLGINKRIVYLKNTDIEIVNRMQKDFVSDADENFNIKKVLINPEILESVGETYYWEACASCLDYVGYVKRPYKIKVKYYDIQQKEIIEEFCGFEATVLSHELDHLEGLLHIDIAEKMQILNVKERKKLRQKEGYLIVSENCNYEKPNKEKRRKI